MQELLNTLTLGSIYLLFALGMALAWSTIGILNFAHGAIFVFSAFSAHIISEHVALSMPVLILISVLVGAAMSALTQWLAFEQILKRSTNHRSAEMRVLIGGIGVAAIPIAIVDKATASAPFGFANSTYKTEVYESMGLRMTNTSLIVIITGVGIAVALTLWLRASRRGLGLRAIGVDSETASLMGVNRTAMALGTMAIAGGLAGLAGALQVFQLQAMGVATGDQLLIKAFAMIVLGGLGSMAGVIFGAFALAGAETLIFAAKLGTWVDAVSFGLIFLVLLVRPQGIFGRQEVRRT
ncbi:branched-chain amino acid ABC transporter permease [Zafaria cholistanensis]|uniref:Branched-chain amino acid ABC transporter permease n=1 Tax=Zafaria cholistanensis TaxID=1682741 RepID=A0A5A7NR38_9MICC|nr:branched-chain amino acid ABC transporter permease [Zafaria cholistanensis]GER22288.1 branched-chain amino acid ABC transporter permease [Zafaria cholistanensis]